MSLTEFFTSMNELLKSALLQVVPHDVWWAQDVIDNAFTVLTLLLLAFVVFFLIIAFFFDFIKDAWKIPLALALDILKYFALVTPWFGVLSAIGGLVIFLSVSNAGFWRYVFAALSFAVGIVVLPSIWGSLVIGVLIAIVPVNTVMMFLSTVLD